MMQWAQMFVRPLALAAGIAACGGGWPVAAQDQPIPEAAAPADEPPVAAENAPAQMADVRIPEGGVQILTIDRDALYTGSAWGRRATAELEAESAKIAVENERLVKQLSDEEATLSEQRKTLDPAEFVKRAEAFDLRATEVRRARARVLEDLSTRAEADQRDFFQAVFPIIGEIMQEHGAVAVLDRRIVIMSAATADITAEVINKVDARIGDRPPPEAERAPNAPAGTDALQNPASN